tara:strand:- start:1747 stop:2076 length:330 start_codon:yes stop_codon:yes gene_type:complete
MVDSSLFKFTKQKHTGKTNVWYDSILIGELSFYIKEDPEMDWPKYRADKALRVEPGERWITTWKAHTSTNITSLGSFKNKEEAAQTILDKHRCTFDKENNENDKENNEN